MSLFNPPVKLDWKKYVQHLLKEDLENTGDITSNALIPRTHQSEMLLFIKEKGILAGIQAAEKIFKIALGNKVKIKKYITDGTKVKPGDIAFRITGPTHKLLILERPILNIMQRMSGIATHTHYLQSLCSGTKARVTDTRKTTPLFRYFEKWAVQIGGGINHRFGLFDAILVKDNHVDANGGMKNVLNKIEKYFKKHKKVPVIIEARTMEDVAMIAAFKFADQILLDNFSIEKTREAVSVNKSRKKLESSGGINENNIRDYALCGVDFISIGAITHHIKSMDLSLKIVK